MTAKRKIIIAVFVFFSLLFSFLAWMAVDRAVNVPESSTWLIPFLWTSLVFVIFSLDIVLLREKWLAESVIAVSLALNFIFGFDFLHLGIFFFVWLLFWAAKTRIRNDLELNIKVCLRKSVRNGAYLMVLGLSLLISSQYYIQAKKADVKKILPRLEVSKSTNKIFDSILSIINPEFRSLKRDGLTVNDLISEIGKKKLGNIGVEGEAVFDSEAVREEGRKYFSDIAGFSVEGDEKAADLFLAIINKNVDERFNPRVVLSENSSIVPAVMTLVLLFTVLSIGVVADLWLVLAVNLFFRLLVRTNVVELKKEMREVEIIK